MTHIECPNSIATGILVFDFELLIGALYTTLVTKDKYKWSDTSLTSTHRINLYA